MWGGIGCMYELKPKVVKVVGMWKGMGGGFELLLLAPDEVSDRQRTVYEKTACRGRLHRSMC